MCIHYQYNGPHSIISKINAEDLVAYKQGLEETDYSFKELLKTPKLSKTIESENIILAFIKNKT